MESDTSPPPTEPDSPVDPRAVEMSERLVTLLNSALGVWRDTVDSQDRLSKSVENLQAEMNDIKEFSALPIFRAGLPLLESNIARVQACKKRIGAVGARLKRLDLSLQPYRQKMKIKEQQAKAARPVETQSKPEATAKPASGTESQPQETKPEETKKEEAVPEVEDVGSQEPAPE
jgi:hypothetical protein